METKMNWKALNNFSMQPLSQAKLSHKKELSGIIPVGKIAAAIAFFIIAMLAFEFPLAK